VRAVFWGQQTGPNRPIELSAAASAI
jgi:hypothetical protein